MNSFYTEDELSDIGLKSYGNNVLISKKASIYSAHNILIGSNVRIDDFCILSGNINLGSCIHISAYSAIYGSHGVIMEDYSGLSPNSLIFSAMDDFSGNYLINPMVDKKLTNVKGGLVILERFVQIGAGSIVFPDLKIHIGSVIGALSLVNKSLDEWGIYAGIPVKRIKSRSKELIKLLNE